MVKVDERNNDVLVHFGVLGMKWGVRKAKQSSSGGSSNSSKTKKASDKKSVSKSSAKRTVAKGAGYTASLMSLLGSVGVAGATGKVSSATIMTTLGPLLNGVAYGSTSVVTKGAVVATAANLPVAALLAGAGVGGIALTRKLTKSKSTKSKSKKKKK